MALISRRRSAAASEDSAASENPQLDLGLQIPEQAPAAQEASESTGEEKPVKVVRRRRVAVKAEPVAEPNGEQTEKQPESYESASLAPAEPGTEQNSIENTENQSSTTEPSNTEQNSTPARLTAALYSALKGCYSVLYLKVLL